MQKTDIDSDFTRCWSEVRLSLDRILASNGVSSSDREDLIQETAARLYRRWSSLDHGRPLVGLAVTIALNLYRDNLRRNREVLCDAPTLLSRSDARAATDVERTGIARLEVARVGRAIKRLSTQHQRSLLGLVADGNQDETRPLSPSEKMIRVRARKRLRSMLETVGVSLVIFATRIRKPSEQMAYSATGFFVCAAMLTGVTGEATERTPTESHSLESVGEMPSDPQLTSGTSFVVTRYRAPEPIVPTESVGASAEQEAEKNRSVSIPLPGGGSADTWSETHVMGITVRVGDYGGAVPACAEGARVPQHLDCDPKTSARVR